MKKIEKRFIDPPVITINKNTCSDCGLCVKICPTRIFRLSKEDSAAKTTTHHPEECVLCGQCLFACSTNSIIYNAPVAIFFHAPVASSTPQTDCDTALFLVQLFAKANDLGTCWNGLIQGAAAGDHLKGFTKLAGFLKIPKDHRCYSAMTLGYSSINMHSIPERKVDVTWIN